MFFELISIIHILIEYDTNTFRDSMYEEMSSLLSELTVTETKGPDRFSCPHPLHTS
jgi:hypothetical protein